MKRPERLKLIAAALLILAYALATHYANRNPTHRTLGAALAVLPLVALALDVIRRQCRPLVTLGAVVMAIGVLVLAWRTLEAHFDWLLLGQQAIAYVLVGAFFATSLLPGRTPVCTRIAAVMQGPLDPATLRYTRHVTLAWAALLLAIAATMAILYGLRLLQAWSLFANFAPLVLLPTMFIVELQVRRRRLPHAPRQGVLQLLHAWRRHAGSRQ
jgi:uncharacterized membrane protein